MDSLIAVGKFDQARALIDTNLSNLERLPGRIDGSSGAPIASKGFNCETWMMFLLYKAGLEITDPSATEGIDRAREVYEKGEQYCFGMRNVSALLPLYRWSAIRAQGGDEKVPTIHDGAPRVHGYDPRVIQQILSDRSRSDKTMKRFEFELGGQSNYFWLGMREYLSKDYEGALRYFSAFLKDPGHGANHFELSAAARLSAKLRFNPTS